MGNKNMRQTQAYMTKYKKLQIDFTSQTPLFDTQNIKFPLSTSAMKIVDAKGKRVKLAGGNWSGGHAQRHCVSGLQYRHIKDLCKDIIKKFDMNFIRLTFSLQMFYKDNKISEQLIKANPQLYGKTSMQIFDATIKALTDAGIMVLLNNHTSKSQWCCTPWDGDGLWYTDQYPEDKFFHCLKELAIRYKDNPLVIGIDLRNEVRNNWHKKPTWGTGVKQTDWRIAAQTIGNQIQCIAPHWLIVIGGIDSQLDLTDIQQHPIKLKTPNKLVYSGHFYSFSWHSYIMTWKLRSQSDFRQKLFNQQTYVRALDNGVPFLLGQFGSNKQDIPWVYLMKYLKQFDIDWCYWCLDGYKCIDKQDQTFGMWTRYYDGIRQPQLLKDLNRVGRPVSNGK